MDNIFSIELNLIMLKKEPYKENTKSNFCSEFFIIKETW